MSYIKKTIMIFLIISIVLSSINIGAFITFSKEIKEDNTEAIEEIKKVENFLDEIAQLEENSELEKPKIENPEQELAEENQQTNFNREKITIDDNPLVDSIKDEDSTNIVINNKDSKYEEVNNKELDNKEVKNEPIKYFKSIAKVNEEVEEYFTYYYTNSEEEKYHCSFSEINNVIKNAENSIIIEMNKDVDTNLSIAFPVAGNYTLDLKGHTINASSGFQAIIIESKANVTIKNGTIKGANANSGGVWYKRGAGIFCRYGTLIIENMTIKENNAEGYGGGIYVADGNFIAINSTITNNKGTTSGGGISLNSTVASIINCEVSNNEQTGTYATRAGGLYVYNSTLTADNVRVISNGKNSEAESGGIHIQGMDSSVQLDNCIVEGNYAKSQTSSNAAGGINIQNGSVTLNNTVIKDNTGNKFGGVGIWGNDVTFIMNSGAIYNNKANNTYKSTIFAHDVFINRAGNVKLPTAISMKDGTSDFDEYYWAHYNLSGTGEEKYEELKGTINMSSNDSKSYDIYNASNQSRMVAELEKENEAGVKFTTINEAVQEASNGDTIKLIANGVIEENVILNGEKSITIDVNNRKWNNKDTSTKALTIEEKANVTITGNGTISDIEHNGESLVLDSNIAINTIDLGIGKFIQAGENFKTDNISFKLSSEDSQKLDNEDIILIKTTSNVSEEVIKKITLSDADPLVIVMANKDENIVAHKMSGIFVNGESGDDINNGLSSITPVKTFIKAKEIFENMSEKSKEKIDGIFVTGTITVSGNEEWSLPKEVSMLRYKGFTGYLVKTTGKLTLANIIIDGQGDKVEADSALIKVESNGTLNIKDGTKLINNKHTKQKSYIEGGGAIYCYNDGHINMLGGEISENTSWYGGGIELWGHNASMELNGGSINNNNAIMVSDDSAVGGGIAVMDGASLNINDGEISYNQSMDSRGIGGGIMVGNDKMYNGVRGATLIMNGGKISSNKANGFGGCGGGIYIQSLSIATINKGEISNNSCGYSAIATGISGEYGGGGIYVNGGKGSYEDGKLYIPNVYISNNTANRNEGAGIAGCGTSTIYIYPKSATIYKNNGTSQIYVDSTLRTGYGNTSKVFISENALGEGINHWSDINREISPEELTNMLPETILALINTNAENLDTTGKLADVKITGNISETRGGGIGSNGYVQIGERTVEYVKGTKIWDDDNNREELRPESITINLFSNGTMIRSKIITAEDNWEYIFSDLLKYDENGNEIIYTITEDKVDGYETKIDGYNIINTYIKKDTQEDPKENIQEEQKQEEKDYNKNEEIKNDNTIIKTADNIVISFIILGASIGIVFIIIRLRKRK